MTSEHDNAEHRVAVNTATRYAALFLTTLTSFVLTPFLLHHIGKPAYGLQALSNQILQFVAMAATAFGVSYERYAATEYARHDYARMNETLSAGLTISMLTAALILLLTGLAAWLMPPRLNLPPELIFPARAALVLMGLGTAAHIATGVWRAPIFIRQRIAIDSVGTLIAVLPAALLVWVLFRLTVPSIITWIAIAVGFRLLAEWGCVIPLSRRALPQMKIRLRLRIPHESLRGLLSFSFLSFVGQLGYLLYYATDSIMITKLPELGIARVADYNVAQRWDPQIRMVATAFIGILTPLMTADAATGNLQRLHKTVVRGSRYALVMALFPCLTLAALAHPFLAAWLGACFTPASVPVLRTVMVGLALSIPGIVGYEALFAKGKIGAAVIATLLCGLLNIVISLGLVRYAGLGLMGITLGSVLALLLLNVLVVPPLVQRHTGLPVAALMGQGCLRPLAGAVPLALFYLGALRVWTPGTFAGIVPLLSLVAAGGLFYLPCVWFLSFSHEDRERSWRTAGRFLAAARQWRRTPGPEGSAA